MTITVTDKIPREHFKTWYELFGSTPGRFVSNPLYQAKNVCVHYRFYKHDAEQYSQFQNNFRCITAPITETRAFEWSWLNIKLNKIINSLRLWVVPK